MGNLEFKKLEKKLLPESKTINKAIENIRKELERYADGKELKGDEIVGWLGEIYAKLLLDGNLVPDDFKYDVQAGNKKVAVKARKGRKSSWKRSSAIPKIEGRGCPTHLMFFHLNDDYSIDRVWLYPWTDLVKGKRFRKHIVRGNFRSYYFRVDVEKDNKYLYKT